MIRVSVLYPNCAGSTFDMEYYREVHIPMVKAKLGSACLAVSVDHGMSGADAGSKPDFLALSHLTFESVSTFQEAFGPNAGAIMADIPNYTNSQPVIQISDVIC